MAKKNAPAKQGEKNFFQKFIGFFKNLALRIAGSFKDMASELKKVTWPTRKELINYSLVVLTFMLVMGVIIGLLDGGAAWLVSVLIRG
ncbi:MAG: preprotein translocase subunit SecE [Candidatus Excrementavichristensenella sp.]|jgi:preprotein translocase subunit SecE|nr:preprotein translocase subunit SecE [Bacillota bacterium]NLL54676.1 preprotein translocase subunit SecE [Clostridiales bacterium]